MKSITVLIVGQIRNQHVLLRSVDNLVALQNRGLVSRVILATWTPELDKIRHLIPRLRAAGVFITTAEQPDASLFAPGNLMNQMRAVDLALETVEDDAWVLRARPDLLIDIEMVTSLAGADMAIAAPGVDTAMKHKIWAPFVELCQPMCVSDITYFGHYADIVKLQNFDFFHEVAWTHLGSSPELKSLTSYDAEIRRYTPAFSGAFPVLDELYRIYNRFLLGVYEIRRSMLTMLFAEEFYWQYTALYFHILEKYFLIGRDVVTTPIRLCRPESFDQTEWMGSLNLLESNYAEQVLAQAPDAAKTIELFAEGPVYCTRSFEVRAIVDHLRGIGVNLDKGLADALAYRKDRARIIALVAFRDRLMTALNNGIERERVKTFAWRHPFATHFVGLPKLDAPA